MKQDAAAWKTRTERFVSAEERKAFFVRSPWRTLWNFAHIWLALAAAFAIVYYAHHSSALLHALFAPFLIVFVGTRINAFAVQVHEASHGLLFDNKRLNDLFCNLAGAYWALNDVGAYWRLHRDHHAFLHEETDPDIELYLLPNNEPGSIVWLLLQDVLGITAARRIHQYLFRMRDSRAGKSSSSPVHMLGKLATLSAVAALFVWVFGTVYGTAYFLAYWIVPLFCVFPVLIRIRIVAEHYSDLLYENVPRLFVSRTSVSNRLEEYLIGAQMQYHMEHHLFPNIPYYQLKRFHRLLWERGFFASLGEEAGNAITGGYLLYWKRLLKRTPESTPANAPTT